MSVSPADIGACVADAAALIEDEYRVVSKAVARAIREERRGTVKLSEAEIRAALEAIRQMTDGNARDFDEWRLQTGGHYATWQALLRAEAKLAAALGKQRAA